MTHRLRADSPHFLKQPLFRHYILSFNEFLESGGSRGIVGGLGPDPETFLRVEFGEVFFPRSIQSRID